jgi:hypothetical protein
LPQCVHDDWREGNVTLPALDFHTGRLRSSISIMTSAA